MSQTGQSILFVGGHDQGGATVGWGTFLGIHPDADTAKQAVPVGFYYSIMALDTGLISERGYRDENGEFVPQKQP